MLNTQITLKIANLWKKIQTKSNKKFPKHNLDYSFHNKENYSFENCFTEITLTGYSLLLINEA